MHAAAAPVVDDVCCGADSLCLGVSQPAMPPMCPRMQVKRRIQAEDAVTAVGMLAVAGGALAAAWCLLGRSFPSAA